MQHEKDYRVRLNSLGRNISRVGDSLALRDLRRMYDVAENLYQVLDRELVECRRLGRYTSQYRNMERRLEDQLNTVGKWTTLALLKYSS